MSGGQDNGQLDPESRQATVEAYWQETEADWADQRAQSEPGDGQDQERAQSEEQSAGVDRPGRQPERLNARGDIPEEVKEQAAEEYAAGDEGLSVVASRYGMSRYTLSMYLREHIRKYRQGSAADELEALRAVLKILEDQPPEICQRVLAYAANYKGVSP